MPYDQIMWQLMLATSCDIMRSLNKRGSSNVEDDVAGNMCFDRTRPASSRTRPSARPTQGGKTSGSSPAPRLRAHQIVLLLATSQGANQLKRRGFKVCWMT